MARPPSEGLAYFSLDTDMDQDDKVGFIESKHGLVGFSVIIRLLMKIYRGNGYYMTWSEREQYLFSSKGINLDITSTLTIVNDCINEGIFNKNLYQKYGILTSHGIQKRYIKGCERRKKVSMIQEYFLIDVGKDDIKLDNVTLTSINVDANTASSIVDGDITSALIPQSKVKESKVNKSKENNPPISPQDDVDVNNPADDLSPDEGNPLSEVSGHVEPDDGLHGESLPKSDRQFMAFWDAYPKKSGMIEGYAEWKKLLGNGVKASELIMAAGKYSFACRTEGKAMQYIKSLPNFLVHGTYNDYLPRHKPDCPHCNGVGWVEGEEPDGYGDMKMVMIQCECRRELSA